jgi:beta-ureidopropionase
VRVGLIQNSIALPTTAHFVDQKNAIFAKLKPIIEAAGSSGVNILCLQVSVALVEYKYFLEYFWCLFLYNSL